MDKPKKIINTDKEAEIKIDPEVNPIDADLPIIKEENPNIIPDIDEFQTPPEEQSVPGERP